MRVASSRRSWARVAVPVGIVLVGVLAFGASMAWAGGAGATCGDGVIDAGESCDDGNVFAGDCCSPECLVEESTLGCAGACRCDTCNDGIDNDRDGRIDAEDPECATLAAVQHFAWLDAAAVVASEESTTPVALAAPVVPEGALVGAAVRGECRAATCRCPETAPDCQAAGRPCATSADCAPIPFPQGASRGWVCAADDAACVAAAEWLQGQRARTDGLASTWRADGFLDGADAELRFTSGVHVVDVTAGQLDGAGELVLAGEGDSVVVVRIADAFVVGPSARVRLADGLAAERVLWIVAPGARFRLDDDAVFAGTLWVDADADVEIGEGVEWQGALLAGARATWP